MSAVLKVSLLAGLRADIAAASSIVEDIAHGIGAGLPVTSSAVARHFHRVF